MASVFNHMQGGRWWGMLFCCYKFGWGWDAFFKEANTGKGLKVKAWMKLIYL